jgi:hypothetical protein
MQATRSPDASRTTARARTPRAAPFPFGPERDVHDSWQLRRERVELGGKLWRYPHPLEAAILVQDQVVLPFLAKSHLAHKPGGRGSARDALSVRLAQRGRSLRWAEHVSICAPHL